MTNILVEYETKTPTLHLFMQIMNKFAEQYGVSVVAKRSISICIRDIFNCDVIISVRGFSWLSYSVIRKAKDTGKFCILLLDDDLLDVEQANPLLYKRKKSLELILSRIDLLLCTNASLMKKYVGKFGCRGKLVNSFVNIEKTNSDNEFIGNESKVNILYAANSSHKVFFETLVSSTIPLLTKKFGVLISLTFIGVRPSINNYDGNIEINYVKAMSYENYVSYMKKHTFHIGLAPLICTEFAQNKYFNKYLDYTSYGIAGVYSNCAPYTYVIHDRWNGLLVDATENAWYEALVSLVSDSRLRQEIVRNAQNHVYENFSPESIVESLRMAVPELTVFKTYKKIVVSGLTKDLVRYRCFLLAEYFAKSFDAIKNYGIKYFINKVYSHLAWQHNVNIR